MFPLNVVYRVDSFLKNKAPFLPSSKCLKKLGIRNDAAAKRLVDAGIDVVQDRCLLVDHRRYAG